MRYRLYILILVLSASFHLKAQEEPPIEAPLQQQNIDTDEKLKTKLGVKFTMGGHTFKGDAFDNSIPVFGFGAGMYNIIDLTKNRRLKLQWELNLTFKGSKFGKPKDTAGISKSAYATYYSKMSLSYAELPVYLSIQLSKSKTPLHLLVGGQVGFLFKSSVIQGLGQYGEVLHNGLPFKKYDFSAGIGLRQDLGSGICVQFTTKYGLTNIYSNKFDPSVTPYYQDVFPRFKDGNHQAHNLSFEFAFLF